MSLDDILAARYIYGGEVLSLADIYADVQKIAAAVQPNDPAAQRRIVEGYMAGFFLSQPEPVPVDAPVIVKDGRTYLA